MTYPETLTYLDSFINYEKIADYPYKESLKLERIENFLDIIGNPQDDLRCIHIAGTKGKGSTCAFISYILKEAGYKTGLYTSPHLSDFRERVRVLSPALSKPAVAYQESFEGMIPREDLTRLTEVLKPGIERYNKNLKGGALSFFEAYTALAFLYFKEQRIDFAVLETGLGGRLDATNVVSPLVCAITPVSYEHTQQLGNTLREIATEKAGIIKGSYPVISAPQEEEAREVIINRCRECAARLYVVGSDIRYEKRSSYFDIKGAFGEYKDLQIKLIGAHQVINAVLAVGVIEALSLHGIFVGIGAIKNGLRKTVWPGRLEAVSKDPLVVLDGAQNVSSAVALKEAVGSSFKYRRLILVFGISKDKDIKGVCGQLYDLADEVVLTRSTNPRATLPADLAGYFNGKKLHLTSDIKEAKAKAYALAQRDDLILVCGSLFLVGEFRNETIRP